MSFLIHFLITLSIIINISTDEDEDYKINEDGEDCSNAPSNPNSEEDCNAYHTEDIACCFVVITKEDNTTENKCWGFQKDLRYFLNYLNVFNYNGYTNVKANFFCNQIDQSCGIDSPKELYECSEHSSKSKSCCLLTTKTKTNCVMSQKKFDDKTNLTILGDNYITCSNYFLPINLIYIFFILYLL